MQRDLICRDHLNSESSGRRCTASRDLVPPLHLVPWLLVKGGARCQEVLNLASGCLHLPLPVRFQTCCNLAAEASEDTLVMRGILEHGDSCVEKPPRVYQDPCVLPRLLRLGLEYRPTEGQKESTLSCKGVWGTEEDTHAPPELILMLLQSGAAESPKDQVIT